MKKERKTVWVAPEFRRVLKKKAAEADKDVVSFTREWAKELEKISPGKKKKDEFGFW